MISGLAQLFGEALVIPLQLLHFFCEGIAFRFAPLSPGRMSALRSRRQVPRWDEYKPSRRTKAPISRNSLGLVGLRQDMLLVLGGESPALGFELLGKEQEP
jgi:hypothetical protein